MKLLSNLLAAFAGASTIFLAPLALAEEHVNVYSARHYDTDLNLYSTFTKQTGVEVRLIEGGSDALMERIANEAEFTPADLLITVDAGRLWRAKTRGLLQAVDSEVLNSRIPSHLRDSEGHWFGLSKRARIIVSNKNKPLPFDITRYEDLADSRLKSLICMRSSSNIYNLSLMSALIEMRGTGAAQQWAQQVVNNFARKPQGNDTSNLAAVASGECGVTIANTYYLGRWLAAGDDSVMNSLTLVFPNQQSSGTHVNISGAGVTKHAPNKANAIRFLEYLTSEYAQTLFAEGNNEYPVVGVTSGPIAALGSFKEDKMDASLLGENQAEAVRVFDRAGWQ